MCTTTYTVSGMTCGHCVNAVTEEVAAIPGVTEVAVDLPTGGLTVTAAHEVDVPGRAERGRRRDARRRDGLAEPEVVQQLIETHRGMNLACA